MKPVAAALPCRPPAASWPPICAWRSTATAPVPRRLLPARPGLPGGATAVGSRWASVPSHRASHQATATAPVLCSRPSETLQGRQHPSTTQAAGKQTVQEKRPGHCRAPWPRAQPPGEGRQAPSELPPPRLRGDTSSAGCPTHSRDDPESRCWPQAARPVPCGEAGFPRAVRGGRLGQSDQGSVQNHAADRWPSWERKPVLAHGYTLPCRLHPQAPQGDRDQRERPAWDSHLLLGGEAQHAPRGADSSTESTRPDLKTGGRPEQTSFQRRHTGGQRAQGKGLNGADGQGDASQATMGVTSGDRRDDRREWGPGQSPSCAAGMYSPTGAMGSGVGHLKTASTELPYDPAIPPLGLHLRKSKTLSRKGICTPALTAALQSQDAEGTQVSRRVDGYGRCCPSPQRDVSQPRGTGTAHHGDSSEGPGGRCSVRETRRGTNAAGGHRDEAPTADSEARRGRGPGESLGQAHGPPTHAD